MTGAPLLGYVRVSTTDQAREGLSLEAQRQRLTGWAQSQGSELLRIESDEGLSGGLHPSSRPGLRAALASVRNGEAAGIVVAKLDRLSRSTRDILDLADESRGSKWRLVSVAESLDTESAMGRFVVGLLGLLAQMERELIGERTQAAMDELRRQSRPRSRFTPWGWRTVDGAWECKAGDRAPLVPCPEERELAARACADRRAPECVAAAWNRAGPNHPRGSKWSARAIRRIRACAEAESR